MTYHVSTLSIHDITGYFIQFLSEMTSPNLQLAIVFLHVPNVKLNRVTNPHDLKPLRKPVSNPNIKFPYHGLTMRWKNILTFEEKSPLYKNRVNSLVVLSQSIVDSLPYYLYGRRVLDLRNSPRELPTFLS